MNENSTYVSIVKRVRIKKFKIHVNYKKKVYDVSYFIVQLLLFMKFLTKFPHR